MRVSAFIVILAASFWSFSLKAQEVANQTIIVPLNEDSQFAVEVGGRLYKTQTSDTFSRFIWTQQVTTVFSPTPIPCGKYYLRHHPGWGYTCERVGYFPWFVAGEDPSGNKWRTEVVGALSSRVEGAVNFQMSVLGMNGRGKTVLNLTNQHEIEASISATGHPPGRNVTFVIIGDAECSMTSTDISCRRKDGIVTGSLMIILMGTSEAVLDAFFTQLTLLYTRNDGTISQQATVPVTWFEDAKNSWIIPIVETPLEVKGATLPPNNSSFAVLNLCEKPQTVRVSVHGWMGEELQARNLPQLVAGEIIWQLPNRLWSGGVRADLVSSLFGRDIRIGSIQGIRVSEELPFRGILRLEGSEKGCKIAVLGLRAAGDSLSAMVAHPEK